MPDTDFLRLWRAEARHKLLALAAKGRNASDGCPSMIAGTPTAYASALLQISKEYEAAAACFDDTPSTVPPADDVEIGHALASIERAFTALGAMTRDQDPDARDPSYIGEAVEKFVQLQAAQVEALEKERDSFRRDFILVRDQRAADVCRFDDARNEVAVAVAERDDLRARLAEAEQRLAVKGDDPIYVNMTEGTRLLEAAGMGKPGKPNTHLAMIKEACTAMAQAEARAVAAEQKLALALAAYPAQEPDRRETYGQPPAEPGTEEGATCNREGCTGVLALPAPKNCRCHLSPPCNECVSLRPTCPECGWAVP